MVLRFDEPLRTSTVQLATSVASLEVIRPGFEFYFGRTVHDLLMGHMKQLYSLP